KTLDRAQLSGRHSLYLVCLKDLPTGIPLPLKVGAVLERADPRDTLVAPDGIDFLRDSNYEAIIATGSNRRRAQWAHRYPQHRFVNLRGNVNTRLEKVANNDWDGAIFAAAGLERIRLGHHISQYLDWMLSSSAQAVIAFMIWEEDSEMEAIVLHLEDHDAVLWSGLERDFLQDMEAGCSATVGAYDFI